VRMDFPEGFKDKKFLLVDDEESIRDSMKMFFLGEGLQIDTVETAEEGLESLAKQHYDIIITDCNLPGMDGLSFFKRIHDLCPDSFKILMTTYAKDLPADALGPCVDECIQKPFSAKLIKDSLVRFMQKKR